jgi:hypothetical protein
MAIRGEPLFGLKKLVPRAGIEPARELPPNGF